MPPCRLSLCRAQTAHVPTVSEKSSYLRPACSDQAPTLAAPINPGPAESSTHRIAGHVRQAGGEEQAQAPKSTSSGAIPLLPFPRVLSGGNKGPHINADRPSTVARGGLGSTVAKYVRQVSERPPSSIGLPVEHGDNAALSTVHTVSVHTHSSPLISSTAAIHTLLNTYNSIDAAVAEGVVPVVLEVQVEAITHPDTNESGLLVSVRDVSARAAAEATLAAITETQLAMVAQLFPLHIIQALGDITSGVAAKSTRQPGAPDTELAGEGGGADGQEVAVMGGEPNAGNDLDDVLGSLAMTHDDGAWGWGSLGAELAALIGNSLAQTARTAKLGGGKAATAAGVWKTVLPTAALSSPCFLVYFLAAASPCSARSHHSFHGHLGIHVHVQGAARKARHGLPEPTVFVSEICCSVLPVAVRRRLPGPVYPTSDVSNVVLAHTLHVCLRT